MKSKNIFYNLYNFIFVGNIYKRTAYTFFKYLKGEEESEKKNNKYFSYDAVDNYFSYTDSKFIKY